MGEYKWEELGLEYQLKETKEPSNEQLQKTYEILSKSGIEVSLNR